MSGAIQNQGKVYPLQDEQLRAANPHDNVWLSASAGTGKTQVLSARVLRLLLRPDVDPSEILCLTFTKAGAAEMATRINAVLARWVRLKPTTLAKELGHLGSDCLPETQERARTLFAKVLDCPGGGLRIDTIHAFSQWLLANFPEEAGLPPGAQPMEDRTKALLAREVLTEMLSEAEATQDRRILDAVEMFVQTKSVDDLLGWLMRCAKAEAMWTGPGGWQSPMDTRVHSLLGIPADADEAWAAEVLHPDLFPDAQLRSLLPHMQAWDTKTGRETAEFIPRWLACDVAGRAAIHMQFLDTVLKKDGEPRAMSKPTKAEPKIPAWQEEIAAAIRLYQDRVGLLEFAGFLTQALELGGAFATRWADAKRREALLDFDDLIHRAAGLLKNSDASAWIRYKLDRQFDHILIDEAQDTNEAQWDIVFALIDDFFSGDAAHGDKLRTIFTVGDYKQAIFGFQGTSPENFARAKGKVAKAIEDARAHIAEMRAARRKPGWQDLDLGRSFRTSKPVLDFVNRSIESVGHEAYGLPQAPRPHLGDDRPGLVTLWKPVIAPSVAGEEDQTEQGEAEERDWLPSHEQKLAENIAEQVRRWVSGEEPYVLAKSAPHRHAEPGDIMVLVRQRGALAAQIVAKLHEKQVAVAGVDRLRLGAPLAVKDLLAALRFATQPLDDLSLANLLSSPLIGWTQDDLLAHLPRDKDTSLWRHLRDSDDPMVIATCDKLRALLARADFETPQSLLAWMLTGPWLGRRRLVERLGREANDPIDELLNAAFAFEAAHVPSLAGFIEWFDASSEELKRDADGAGGQVRVMTVHGSKGLQAPIVILADATRKPGKSNDLELPEAVLGQNEIRSVPIPSVAQDSQHGLVKEAAEAARNLALQEHWRLLYVAMTRAEEALFIGGALDKNESKKGLPHEDSWYARLEPIFGESWTKDDLWGARCEVGHRADPVVIADEKAAPVQATTLPEWAITPIGPEASPPRPLSPSRAGEEQGADPPMPADALAIAARRGVVLHRLLERLPDVPEAERESAGQAWLDRQAGDLDSAVRAEILSSAMKVLSHPDFAELFSTRALAEVPLTATVGGTVIAGTVDRLMVSGDEIMVVDFKTARRPPTRVEAIPRATLKQMAAYVAALEVIFPGKRVQAGVLYTQTPMLIAIPDAMLATHKEQLGETQESFAPLDIE